MTLHWNSVEEDKDDVDTGAETSVKQQTQSAMMDDDQSTAQHTEINTNNSRLITLDDTGQTTTATQSGRMSRLRCEYCDD